VGLGYSSLLVRATSAGPKVRDYAGMIVSLLYQVTRLWGLKTLLCVLTWADSVGDS
jgi:hypothetical protein